MFRSERVLTFLRMRFRTMVASYAAMTWSEWLRAAERNLSRSGLEVGTG